MPSKRAQAASRGPMTIQHYDVVTLLRRVGASVGPSESSSQGSRDWPVDARATIQLAHFAGFEAIRNGEVRPRTFGEILKAAEMDFVLRGRRAKDANYLVWVEYIIQAIEGVMPREMLDAFWERLRALSQGTVDRQKIIESERDVGLREGALAVPNVEAIAETAGNESPVASNAPPEKKRAASTPKGYRQHVYRTWWGGEGPAEERE
jgi:hypothetical protein